jgi:hypothetical protein
MIPNEKYRQEPVHKTIDYYEYKLDPIGGRENSAGNVRVARAIIYARSWTTNMLGALYPRRVIQ